MNQSKSTEPQLNHPRINFDNIKGKIPVGEVWQPEFVKKFTPSPQINLEKIENYLHLGLD